MKCDDCEKVKCEGCGKDIKPTSCCEHRPEATHWVCLCQCHGWTSVTTKDWLAWDTTYYHIGPHIG